MPLTLKPEPAYDPDPAYVQFEGWALHGFRAAAADLAGIGYTLPELYRLVAEIHAEVTRPVVAANNADDPIPIH